MEIFKKISLRLLFAIALFFMCNFIYEKTWYKSDVIKYSRVRGKIDTAFNNADIVYMGESSNTSFNPWTDTLVESISDFLQLYLPSRKVSAITHESFHPGLFLKMLNLLPDYSKSKKNITLVITMNLRTCGPSAMFSGNEAANQQEALFYSNRLPLLTRIFLSLHFYDNRNEPERELLKVQFWRTHNLEKATNNIVPATPNKWLNHIENSGRIDTWRHMADAYVKEFGFILDEKNQRVKDLEEIARICKQKNIHLVYHLLPENRDYAQLMFGKQLVQIMDNNAAFLIQYFTKMNVSVINNYSISNYTQYTDQWYPTEHFNAVLRKQIAENIAKEIAKPNSINAQFQLKQNNFPNWDIKQPMADTMLKRNGILPYP